MKTVIELVVEVFICHYKSMRKILTKKSFYDGWDNLPVLAVFNIVFFLIFIAFLFWNISFAFLILFLPFSFHLLGVNGAVFSWISYEGKGFYNYAKAIKEKWKHALLFYAICCFVFLSCLYTLPAYLTQESFGFIALGFCLLFILLLSVLLMFFYFPLAFALPKDGPLKTVKKCFLVIFDNFGFCLHCMIKNILDLAISVLTALLVPGITGLCITQNNAVRFLMKKYDWLEENNAKKLEISESELLKDDIQLLSTRNLRNLINP